MDDLVKVGIPEAHARAIAYKLQDFKDSELATKGDLKALDVKLETRLKELELRLTLRLGGMIVAGVLILAVLIKL